jgi:hypothetical protein
MSGAPPDRVLQRWGVIAGAGVVAAALVVSTLTAPEDPPPPAPESADATSGATAPPAATPAPPAGAKTAAEVASAGEPTPIVEPADVGGPPPAGAAYPSLLVRFEAPHPMARAQALAAAGRFDEAAESARQTIRTRRDLRGLCYDRFTNGGAEVVLRACAPVPRAQRTRFQETWAQRLNSVEGVEYAEPNYTLYPETKN